MDGLSVESSSDSEDSGFGDEEAQQSRKKERWSGCTVCCCLCGLACVLLGQAVLLQLVRAAVDWSYWSDRTPPYGDCPVAYDAALMRPVVEAARASFCSHARSGIGNWSCEPCVRSNLTPVEGSFTPVRGSEIFEANRTHGYVVKVAGPAAFAGACLIAFRGTTNLANGLTDVDALLQSLPWRYRCLGCSVHSGFYQAWDGVESEVVATLRSIGCEDGVIITGHSMGAALATLAAMSLTQVYGFRLRMFYSFESPRVGNPAFHANFQRRVVGGSTPAFRLTYDRDIVPHVPLMLADFEHVGCEVYYSRNGTARACPNSEDDACSDQWPLPDTDANLQGGPDGGEHCNTVYAGDICTCPCRGSPDWCTAT